MKNISIQTLASAAAIAILLGLAGTSTARADQPIIITAGNSFHMGPEAPPQHQADPQWASPSPTAVWIRGHNEWKSGGYVWVGGFYDYPPQKDDHWVSPVYSHDGDSYTYQPGYWAK